MFSRKMFTRKSSDDIQIPIDTERRNLPKYIPNVTKGRVINVYDGDTFTLAARIPNDKTIYKFSVRLRGLDCPEMRTNNESEKLIATKARDFVASKVLGEIVTLINLDLDKYGRLLAGVLYKEQKEQKDLSEELISERLAVVYDGGTKKTPSDWIKYGETGEM
jgi:micrococcal nuclease